MGTPMIVTAGSGDRAGWFRRRGFDDSGIVTSNSGIVTADSDDCDRAVLVPRQGAGGGERPPG